VTGAAAIDPRAAIDASAEIGNGVEVGAFVVIGAGVRVGDGCRILSGTVIQGETELGPGNVIGPMASIGGDPQDLKYAGEPTRLIVGANNRIREYVTMNRGTEGGGGVTRVGDNGLYMAYAHVAHDCVVGNDVIFANAATLAGHVEVGDNANVGAYSGVHQFCRVARHAFIGGYSVVTQDALPWVITVGNRAKAYGLNSVGLKRLGYPNATVQAIKRCYKLLFRSKTKLAEALDQAEAEVGDNEQARYFIEFVRSSQRGICR
jgi:UDP-N-acetylglucosamine acyltransferase